MAATFTYPHIIKEQGQPARLENHPRLRVAMVVAFYLSNGRSPERICAGLPHVRPAEVYSALAYYFDHQQEIDAEIQAEVDLIDEEARTRPPSPIWLKLKAKGLI